jgi:hypothetical protein
MDRRTRASWLIVVEFGVALAALAIWWSAVSSAMEPMIGADREEVFGLSSSAVVAVVSAVGLVTGVVWMIRITRGSRDEPPPWRYRDH